MDKPRHPLVTRPVENPADPTNQMQPTADQNGKKSTGVSIRNRQRSFILRKPASRVPRRLFEIDTFRNHDNGNKDVRTNALEFFGLTPLRARE